MAISRETNFTVDGTPDDLLEPMVRALSDMRCHRFNREGTVVTARTMINWRSVGEVMTVALSDAGHGQTRVDVASRSALRTVILDWGANNSNLRRFEAAFRKRIAALTRDPVSTR
jgi:hypothetical protein